MSLRGAIAAFKAAKDEGFDNNSVIDEGFGVRALRELSTNSASACSATGTGR